MLGGLSLIYNLKRHFVYADVPPDICEECSVWQRKVSPMFSAQYCVYALHLATLIGE